MTISPTQGACSCALATLGLPDWAGVAGRGLVSVKRAKTMFANGLGPAVRILLHRPVVNQVRKQQISRQEVTTLSYNSHHKYRTDINGFVVESDVPGGMRRIDVLHFFE
jgi:hypothetical protein